MMKPLRWAAWALAACMMLVAAPSFAQETSAAISGRVVDASGAPIAGATVEIVHAPSGTTKVLTTDAEGRYIANGMRVGGPFHVIVSKDGQATAERDDVFLRLAQNTTVNLIMGGGAEDAQQLGTITVTAGALAETFSPDNKGLGTNISQRELEAMPNPGRNIQNVARTDPRVVVVSRAEGKISALGQNFRYNNITVDSVGTNDPFGLNPNGLPTVGTAISQDTIAEYNIATANYDVSTRRGLGANINAVTKSGTNEFHGSAYYVFQDASWIGDFNGAEFDGYDREWTAGATVGGPILKDKLFFFLSYEESERVGGGSAWGPEGSGSAQTVEGITQEDLDTIRDIAAGYGLNDIGGFTAGKSSLSDKRYLAKLDWNINSDHRASLTWRKTDEAQPNINGGNDSLALSSAWVLKDTNAESWALHLYDDWTTNFSSNTSISHSEYQRVGGPYNGVPMPAITVHVGGFRGPAVDFGTNYSYQANRIDTKTLFANWEGIWYAGDHTVKFGFDYQKDDKYNLFLQDWYGAYSFDSIEDFANGDYSTRYYHRPADGLTLDDVAANFTIKSWGLFAQDTWQVNDQLSVTYGVRMDSPSLGSKPLANPAFAEAGFTTPDGTVLTSNQYNLSSDNLVQPRFSFNYRFDTERMMQLRGGVGLFMTNPPAVWIGNIYSNAGVNVVEYLCQTFRGCDGPDFTPDPLNQPDGLPDAGQMTVNTLDPDFRLPSSWKFSLGFDTELPWSLIGSVEYEQLQVRDAIWYQNLNLGAPTARLPDGRMSYYALPYQDPRADGQEDRANANNDYSASIINLANTSKGRSDNFTVSIKKPFENDWSAMVGLTWNNAEDVNPGLSSVAESSWDNWMIANANENVASTSNYEIEWRAIASLSWRHAFFGNYYTRFSAFYDGRTGHPYSWAFGNDSNGDGTRGNDLVYIPNVGDVEFREGTSEERIQQFYDYIASNDYLSGHQGQIAERNGDRAGWFNQVDLSISQEIPGLFDGNKGIIRLDIYNFLNLLDSDWGTERKASFPGLRNLADFYGVNPDTGKYIYDITGDFYTDENGNYRPEVLPYSTYPDDRAQRWGVQLTVRYKF